MGTSGAVGASADTIADAYQRSSSGRALPAELNASGGASTHPDATCQRVIPPL